jgi:hypothetical protein
MVHQAIIDIAIPANVLQQCCKGKQDEPLHAVLFDSSFACVVKLHLGSVVKMAAILADAGIPCQLSQPHVLVV